MLCQHEDKIVLLRFVLLVVVVLVLILTKYACSSEYDETDIYTLAVPYVGEEEAAVCSAVCYELGELEDIDPLVIADVWLYQAGFQKRPKGFYIGGLQLHPDHLNHFSEYGLRIDDWKHWIWYGVKLWRGSADKDRTLRQALQPWGVRD